MHEHRTTTVLDPLPDTTTLDGDRADRFGSFLAVEAAADASSGGTVHRFPARRLVAGAVAATVLAGGLLAVSSIAGAPGSGPSRVEAAVAIEQEGGWTTISITDPDATPAEIEAALKEAGVDVRVATDGGHGAPIPVGNPDPAAGPAVFYGLPITTDGSGDHRAYFSVAMFAGAEPGDLTGLSVDFALPDDFELSAPITADPVDPTETADWVSLEGFDDAMAEQGVRVGGDQPAGTIAIQDGADAQIILLAKP